ncbi:hypothetical protein [uncultured Methanobrevibacter sp.]|uniref:hypothetical protein n=1 Tax=uncultured Methanobrevibacter sp. TaxID=253161 RepID=UPI0025E3A19D|nr:hypothetical protein [uncultured Methanobrevibacter sp.]
MTDLLNIMTEVNKVLYGDNYSEDAKEKFNYAIVKKTESGRESEEFWILVNADYDYETDRFIKIDLKATSFGIQMQAKGTYPGEAELGYDDIQGINVWRNPRWLNDNDEYIVYMDENYYDYTDMKDKHYIGAQYSNEAWGVHNGEWRHFGVASGWNNNLMTDSFGGVTIGGAGFEIDGNGVFPFVRLTSSTYIDENNVQWFLLGLLDNAYHPTTAGWECDNNSHYSWFVGLRSPQKFNGNTPVYLTKDLEQTTFVVMVNDNSGLSNPSTEHQLNVASWKVLFEVGLESVKCMINGTLTTLGA